MSVRLDDSETGPRAAPNERSLTSPGLSDAARARQKPRPERQAALESALDALLACARAGLDEKTEVRT